MPKQMNIFEDLIEELKDENLLEKTVIDVRNKKNNGESFDQPKQNRSELTAVEAEKKSVHNLNASEIFDTAGQNVSSEFFQNSEDDLPSAVPLILQDEFAEDNYSFESETPLDQAEFFKKRATDEVNSLQMVEHVLSGVERDFLGVTPKLYDDLEVKKALHSFLQLAQNINSPEQANAEFLLLQETESWYSALSQKDKNITIANLRRYCETSRPALSFQALAALARFYRNAPFSESVRSKFEMVTTRFFARETGGDIRKLVLNHDGMIEKLNEFYAEWSSIPLYSTDDEDESKILLSAIKFEEFTTEVESAQSIEELFKTDFFNRFKNFKDDTHENFFAPLITATSIESNIRIGNRYLALLLQHKQSENFDAELFAEKYAAYDEIVSEVICKTVGSGRIFAGQFTDADVTWDPHSEQAVSQPEFEKQNLNKPTEKPKPKKEKSAVTNSLFKVNKWLLAGTLAALFFSIGLYAWAEYFIEEPKLSDSVKVVNLDNSSFKEYIQTARINNDMFYGIVNVNWDGLTNEKKEDLFGKILVTGGEKGFKQVTLMNRQGRTVGYGSAEKIEIYNP